VIFPSTVPRVTFWPVISVTLRLIERARVAGDQRVRRLGVGRE
jgi:hypothetical protein